MRTFEPPWALTTPDIGMRDQRLSTTVNTASRWVINIDIGNPQHGVCFVKSICRVAVESDQIAPGEQRSRVVDSQVCARQCRQSGAAVSEDLTRCKSLLGSEPYKKKANCWNNSSGSADCESSQPVLPSHAKCGGKVRFACATAFWLVECRNASAVTTSLNGIHHFGAPLPTQSRTN